MIRIGYGCNSSVTPFGFDILGKAAIKCIKSGAIILAIMIETLKEVFNWWVFCLITDQNNDVSFQKKLNKIGRPSF
ncbi:hypothetical protein ABW09_00025 [Pluralibacter gergoviae]|nr:hypothetical protein ABW09_00025 [Pluralibacter gergoviae]